MDEQLSGYAETVATATNDKTRVIFSMDDIVSDLKKGNFRARDYLDHIFRVRGQGTVTTGRDLHFTGFNHRHIATNLPPPADHNGYAFFVRPMLHLSRDACLRVRYLSTLLTKNKMSLQQWARITLDPYICNDELETDSPLVDNENAFIPLLSNTLRTLSNPPSVVANTWTSERGLNKEVFSIIDDNVINYEAYNVTASFRNTNGNPLLILFYSWILTASMTFIGKMQPRWEDRLQHRINYTTRIYRLVMDHTKTFITNFWAPVYCFPTSIETGSIFKYDIEQPLNKDLNNIDVQFQCVGSIYNDPMLLQQFNQTVVMANSLMHDNTRFAHFVKLPSYAIKIFNFYGYPWVNINTMELEWWVPKELYATANSFREDALSNNIAPPEIIDEKAEQEFTVYGKTGMNPDPDYNLDRFRPKSSLPEDNPLRFRKQANRGTFLNQTYRQSVHIRNQVRALEERRMIERLNREVTEGIRTHEDAHREYQAAYPDQVYDTGQPIVISKQPDAITSPVPSNSPKPSPSNEENRWGLD